MSSPAEQVTNQAFPDKPKRKYTKRPVAVDGPEIPPNPPIQGKPARKVEQTAEVFEYTCHIPLDTYFETSASGDRLKKHHTCANEATWVPMVTFYGKRKEETPPGSKEWVIKIYPYKVRYGLGSGVCNAHREAIEKDVRVLVSGQELENQTGNMQTIGLPKPKPNLTKITFERFTPPKAEIESAHLDSLMGLDNESEEVEEEEMETL